MAKWKCDKCGYEFVLDDIPEKCPKCDCDDRTLRKEVYPVLDSIADAIKTCPNDILIMGQTDSIPVKS
ncbi:MAG: hypothetical protein P8Y97_03050, partial [Candidatus Lokiarchaeota archaeon]